MTKKLEFITRYKGFLSMLNYRFAWLLYGRKGVDNYRLLHSKKKSEE